MVMYDEHLIYNLPPYKLVNMDGTLLSVWIIIQFRREIAVSLIIQALVFINSRKLTRCT